MSGSFPADLEEMRQSYVRAQEADKRAADYEQLVQMEKLKDQIDVAKCRQAYMDAYVKTGSFKHVPLVCFSKEQAYPSKPSAWLTKTFGERHAHYKIVSYEDRGETSDERVYVYLDHTKFHNAL